VIDSYKRVYVKKTGFYYNYYFLGFIDIAEALDVSYLHYP
jgi:hypothetical protein